MYKHKQVVVVIKLDGTEILKFPTCPVVLTCRCNVDPLTPHFYIVKLEFTGVYMVYLLGP